ncbi:MAG: aldo/keto reductase [Frankiaceae bacterium]|nr:aldo/keto reductase [Frankiaceae bacterium]MBV9871951.1 aldo/keto reductase [Frankiaceae bacterium]
MRFRQLGDSGLTVSVVGLGCNNFGRRIGLDETRAVVRAALDGGITLFDTSDTYGQSEDFLGEVLGAERDNIVLATKFGMSREGALGPDWGARGSRRYIRKAVESSLRRLRTDWIDLYQYHVPDGKTPVEETLAALHELVVEGKVRYIGHSNFTGWQVADAAWIAKSANLTPFVSAQNHYSLIERGVESELVPACQKFGLGVLPYFPLANGLLTGKYTRGKAAPEGTRLAGRPDGLSDEKFDKVDALQKYADERGISLLDVAIGGLAAKRAVASVIAGATKPEQVVANVAAGQWSPSRDDLRALNALP